MSSRHAYDIQNVLQEMREDYWRGIEEAGETAAETREYLVFQLSGERFGMPTAVAKEVLRVPKLVRVPKISEFIRGIINLRGEIVAVTDLRPILRLTGRDIPAGARLIVTQTQGMTTALLAETVEGIRAISVGAVEPLTTGLEGFPRDVAAGQVAIEGGYLILLDMAALLSRPELTIELRGE